MTPVGTDAAPAPRRRRSGPGTSDIQPVTARLLQVCASLEAALERVPRPSDFEPLSEPIYELARHTPRLVELLDDAPASVVPLGDSVAALRECIQSLENLQAGLSESLLRLPRAEDYDPLTTPLRDFSQAAPRVLEGLRDIPALTRALAEAIARINEQPRSPESTPAPAFLPRLTAMAERVESARQTIETALATLPDGAAYSPLAAQLRELATVSPSLMEWLSEVPKVSAPLTVSVKALRAAATSLAAIRDDLVALGAPEELSLGGPGARDES
jgi:ABC-type transporter Mla subunit MlaD